MPEQQSGQSGVGGDDGVVYLGRNSFKMKVGANLTPPAGTPPARRGKVAPPAAATMPAGPTKAPAFATPPPVLTTPPPVVTAPPPASAAPRPAAGYRRSSVPLPVLEPPGLAFAGSASSSSKSKMLVTGLCMIAFSCGVMTTEAVERFWPRSRGGSSASAAAEAVPAGFEVTRQPAIPAARPIEVAPMPAGDPDPADRAAPAPSQGAKPSAEAVLPEAAPAKSAVLPAPRTPVAARFARGTAAVRVLPAQGRVAVRKRPSVGGAGAQPSAGDATPPSGDGWADPFAQ